MNDNMEFLDASGEMSELFNSSGAVEDLTAAGGFSFGGDGFSDPFAEEDMLYQLLAEGSLTIPEVNFSSKSICIQPNLKYRTRSATQRKNAEAA